MPRAGWLLGVVGVTAPIPVVAVAAPPAPERPPSQQWVDFRARHVEVDTQLQRLELTGDVRVTSGRFQLTGDRLRLEQGPRGAVVEGPGRIAFCRCAHPPVAFGFRSATVAPPTDLLVAGPTLDLFGLPVLWAPYLWLRAPSRAGLLPVKLELRGHDGWLLGSGVHVPWGETSQLGQRSALDLGAAGYLKGGVEVTADLTTERTTTAVRWDHLVRDLVAVQAHGFAPSHDLGATAAWALDALRGPRALSGTPSLEMAARRFDRARGSLVRSGENTVLVWALRADETRGTGLGELGAAGPRLSVGHYQPILELGTLEWEADATSLAHPSLGALSLLGSAARARFDARPATLTSSIELGERVGVAVTESATTGDVESFGRAVLAWPLVRAYGKAGDPWLHWVEPYAESSLVIARRRGEWVELPDGNALSLLAGMRTALGRLGARGALAANVQAGWVGAPDAPEPVAGATLAATTEYIAVAARTHWLWRETGGIESSAHARCGRLDRLHVTFYVEGRSRIEPLAARLLAPDPWRRPAAGWLDRRGWTSGSEVLVPWTNWLSSSFGADRDLTASEWLGWRGALGYRHPCGCLGLVAGTSARTGRRGLDAWLSVQLVP